MDKKAFETEECDEKVTTIPEFKPLFSKSDRFCEFPVHHGLFEETPEQITHGKAPWDKYGWSRDSFL